MKQAAIKIPLIGTDTTSTVQDIARTVEANFIESPVANIVFMLNIA